MKFHFEARNMITTADPHCRIGKITPKRYSRYRINPIFAKTTLALRRNSQSRDSRGNRA
jgi:hypothetical protein